MSEFSHVVHRGGPVRRGERGQNMGNRLQRQVPDPAWPGGGSAVVQEGARGAKGLGKARPSAAALHGVAAGGDVWRGDWSQQWARREPVCSAVISQAALERSRQERVLVAKSAGGIEATIDDGNGAAIPQGVEVKAA